MGAMFAKGRSSGRPRVAMLTRAQSVEASASQVQAKGQFGKPSGKSGTSPLSMLSGSAKGIGKGKLR